jgi:hypothetical protein
MSSINSHADVVTDWEGLLEAGDRSPELQASTEGERQSLRLSLTEVQSLKARQKELKALGQAVTQQLKAAVDKGKEVAMRFRSVVKGKIGPKNELLVHFGVAPLRRRPRKPTQLKPSDGETPGTSPGASASPPAKPVV